MKWAAFIEFIYNIKFQGLGFGVSFTSNLILTNKYLIFRGQNFILFNDTTLRDSL